MCDVGSPRVEAVHMVVSVSRGLGKARNNKVMVISPFPRFHRACWDRCSGKHIVLLTGKKKRSEMGKEKEPPE